MEESLAIAEEIGDKLGMSGSLNNIGIVYLDNDEFDKAIEYYNKALSINKELGEKSSIALNMSNIGNVFKQMKNVLFCFQNCFFIFVYLKKQTILNRVFITQIQKCIQNKFKNNLKQISGSHVGKYEGAFGQATLKRDRNHFAIPHMSSGPLPVKVVGSGAWLRTNPILVEGPLFYGGPFFTKKSSKWQLFHEKVIKMATVSRTSRQNGDFFIQNVSKWKLFHQK